MTDEAELYRHELLEIAAEFDDDADGEVPRGRGDHRPTRSRPRSARAASTARSRRSRAAPRSRTRASSRCSTRSSTTCRRRSTSPRSRGTDLKTDEEVERPADAKAPFAALAFKVMTDPYVGKLTYFRVYSGTLSAGSYVLNSTKGHKERIGRLLQMHANHREDVDAVVRRRHRRRRRPEEHDHRRHAVRRGRTRCFSSRWSSRTRSSTSRSSPRPRPTRRSSASSLAKLAEEDPTFRVRTDTETGQTIIAGMGELHLEIIVDRLLREFKVEANVGKPQVAYRETASKAVKDVETKFVRQTGGRGQYGHVVLNVEPQTPGDGYDFENKIVGGVDPQGVHPGGRQGHPGGHRHRRPRRLPGRRHQGRPWSTARTTRSTPRRWLSRSPARWASRRRSARRVRCSSSR